MKASEIAKLDQTCTNGTRFRGAGHYFTSSPDRRVDMVEVQIPKELDGMKLFQDFAQLGNIHFETFLAQFVGWKGLNIEYRFVRV